MGKETLIRMLVAMLGEFLLHPASAAPYVKWLIRGREYLNLLVPPSLYPSGPEASTIAGADPEAFAIPLPPHVPAAPPAKKGGK